MSKRSSSETAVAATVSNQPRAETFECMGTSAWVWLVRLCGVWDPNARLYINMQQILQTPDFNSGGEACKRRRMKRSSNMSKTFDTSARFIPIFLRSKQNLVRVISSSDKNPSRKIATPCGESSFSNASYDLYMHVTSAPDPNKAGKRFLRLPETQGRSRNRKRPFFWHSVQGLEDEQGVFINLHLKQAPRDRTKLTSALRSMSILARLGFDCSSTWSCRVCGFPLTKLSCERYSSC